MAGSRWPAALADITALVAGSALPFAFAPFHLFPLAVISPAVLFRLWSGAPARRAFRRGWLYGLGMFGVGVSWIQISVHQFGLPLLAFSVSVTVLFVAVLALYPACTGWLANRFFPSQDPLRFILALPALWTSIEWARGWFLTGFPWLNLGYSQVDGPLRGIAPILGVYGVSLATAVSAGLLCWASGGRGRARYLAMLIPLWGGSWLLAKTPWTEAVSPPLEVALIQGNIPQSVKWSPQELKATLDKYLALSAPYWGRDLIVWPETAIPALYHEVSGFTQGLDARARDTGTELLVGVPYRDPTQNRFYNSVVGIGPRPGFYHKRHLVPFGEYIPFGSVLGELLEFLAIPMSSFTAGAEKQPVLKAAGHGIGISICYEDAFGEEVIDSLPEAGLLVNVSNDAWFGDSFAPHQHLEMARMRALETGRYLLRSTNTGVSAVIDPKGSLVARSPQFEAHALTTEVWAYRGATPYVRVGNGALIIAVIAMLGFSWIKSRRRRVPASAKADSFSGS